MKKNPLNEGMIEVNSAGIGEVSAGMVEGRAGELALIAGRPANSGDDEQALRELTGGAATDGRQAWLESLSEDERWDPVGGASGHQAEEPASETEDENGQGRGAQLFEEGVGEAAHDQMVQAALAFANTHPSDS